jgi:hypothetical protein
MLRKYGGVSLQKSLPQIGSNYTIWANDCHIANLVIINWLVGAGNPAISLARLDIDKPAPTKCDIRKTPWYYLGSVKRLPNYAFAMLASIRLGGCTE